MDLNGNVKLQNLNPFNLIKVGERKAMVHILRKRMVKSDRCWLRNTITSN